jgi:glycine cleavage system H protein
MVALLILLTILMFLTVDYLVQRRQLMSAAAVRSAGPADAGRVVAPQIRYRTPQGVFFSPGHTWFYLEESGAARIGVNDLAQAIVGRLDRVQTRAVGDTVRRGDVLLKLRHGERSITVRSPIDGTIESVNDAVLERRDLRDVHPLTSSWFYRVKPKCTSDCLKNLLIGDAATDWLSREVQRLKVILSTIAPQNPVLGATLQDGGLPAWGLIDLLDEAEWNQVQERFFE